MAESTRHSNFQAGCLNFETYPCYFFDEISTLEHAIFCHSKRTDDNCLNWLVDYNISKWMKTQDKVL